MVERYLTSGADPALYDFLRHDFDALTARHGGVVATTFRNFPSFPQRYMEPVDMPPADPLVNRAAQAADAADRVHRGRPAHPPVHRVRHAATDAEGAAPSRMTCDSRLAPHPRLAIRDE